jgi:hypothetical protein
MEDDITYEVEPFDEERNRLTVAFRLILAIPHLILVGGPGIGLGSDRGNVFGAVAGVCAIVNWFAILFTGKAIGGLQELQLTYLRWRANAIAYVALLRDEYPPFLEGEYPVRAAFPARLEDRNKVSVFFRPFLLIPHAIVLFFLLIAWAVTALIGWFAVLFTGRYPQSFWTFGEGVLRWGLRVEAYGLLLHDKYPPFRLGA